MYTGGERNETHYIYTTHSDAKNQFTFFSPPKKIYQSKFLPFYPYVAFSSSIPFFYLFQLLFPLSLPFYVTYRQTERL